MTGVQTCALPISFWSQILILYKLHHLFPNLKTFRNYFAKDFDYDKVSAVDQIMGAFILTSKEVIEIGRASCRERV